MLRWLQVGLIAVAALALIVFSIKRNLSDAALRTNPALALAMAPDNGMAENQRVRLGLATLMQKPKGADYSRLSASARGALLREPMASASLVAIAEDERLKGRVGVANSLLDHAAGLSRRDAVVQMELIKRSSAAGDVPELLHHVDETLRANQGFYGAVFPFLARALRDPGVVKSLMPLAREDPEWYRLFIGEALTDPSALSGVRQLLLAVPDGRAAIDPQIRANLINQLVAAKRVALARSYFQALHPGIRGSIIDADFTRPALEGPFGWVLNEDPDLTADFIRGEGLVAFASSDREGTVARQLLSLRPGSYKIGVDAAPGALSVIYLELTCHASGRKLPVSADRQHGTFSFVVPPGCEDQWLGLGLRDGDDARQAEASIHRLRLL